MYKDKVLLAIALRKLLTVFNILFWTTIFPEKRFTKRTDCQKLKTKPENQIVNFTDSLILVSLPWSCQLIMTAVVGKMEL